MVDAADSAVIYCSVCGRPLGLFPEDQPDWATGPLCGECFQSYEWEVQVASDALYEEDEQGW